MLIDLKEELLENTLNQLFQDRYFPLDEEAAVGIVSEAIDIAFQNIDKAELSALSEDYETDKIYEKELEEEF